MINSVRNSFLFFNENCVLIIVCGHFKFGIEVRRSDSPNLFNETLSATLNIFTAVLNANSLLGLQNSGTFHRYLSLYSRNQFVTQFKCRISANTSDFDSVDGRQTTFVSDISIVLNQPVDLTVSLMN